MKQINEYTVDELSEKIQAIKNERERTANALKRYEEELERRKNKNWLPLGDVLYSANYELVDFFCVELKMETTFENYSCFLKYLDFLKAINKALVANAKGEPISIEVLLPLLKKGWVAMDGRNNTWFWYDSRPEIGDGIWRNACNQALSAFNIQPAENWETSLMECGL